MAQFNLVINGVVMNAIDTLGASQPSSAAHSPQPQPKSVPASRSNASVADVKTSNATVQDALSNRA